MARTKEAKLLDAFLEARDPTHRAWKKRNDKIGNSGKRQAKKTLESYPAHVLAKQLLRLVMKEKERKDDREKKRRARSSPAKKRDV